MKVESMFAGAHLLRLPGEEALGGNLSSLTPPHVAPVGSHARLFWPLRDGDAIRPGMTASRATGASASE